MKTLALSLIVVAAGASSFVVGCDTSDATNAVVDNSFPPPFDGGDVSKQIVVFKVWWSVTLFPGPVGAGAPSETNRVVPGSDYAYALLAPNWDPSSATPPATLIPVKTKNVISGVRGETVHIVISDTTVVGDCGAGSHLSQEDADFITQRIFPGDFAAVTYEPSTCVSTPIPSDAGTADAGTETSDVGAEGGAD